MGKSAVRGSSQRRRFAHTTVGALTQHHPSYPLLSLMADHVLQGFASPSELHPSSGGANPREGSLDRKSRLFSSLPRGDHYTYQIIPRNISPHASTYRCSSHSLISLSAILMTHHAALESCHAYRTSLDLLRFQTSRHHILLTSTH